MKRIISLLIAVVLLALCIAGCGDSNKLSLDQTELNITVGDTVTLDAGDAAKLKWTSDNEDVATVHAGTVSAKSAGSANITVTAENGDSQVCAVTVTDKLISTITLGASSVKLGLGKTIQLSVSFSPPDASDKELTWSSKDESVALVDENGYVTGQSAGSTEIVCSSKNGVSASCTVTVDEAPEAPTTTAYTEPPTSADETTSPSESSDPTSAPVYSDDFIFPDSSTRMLSDGEVSERFATMSGSPVAGSFSQDAVNEIFARHGYIFKTDYIRAYYESKSWYKPDPDFSMSYLSDIEEYNIDIFSKY